MKHLLKVAPSPKKGHFLHKKSQVYKKQLHISVLTVVHPWTMSGRMKYRAAIWSFLKLTPIVFHSV